MIDEDLAALYGVPTKRLNQQVSRNRKRFPEDFMFQLTKAEAENLRLQFATSRSTHGGRRSLPHVFTEEQAGSAKGAEYESQGQARSAAKCVALGKSGYSFSALKERNNLVSMLVFRTFSAY